MPGPNPFKGIIEACDDAGSRYDPTSGRVVEGWHEHLGELTDAVSRMLAGHGTKMREEFPLNSAPADLASSLGGVFGRFRSHTDEAASAFVHSHEQDLGRLNEPRRNEDRWDVAANRDVE